MYDMEALEQKSDENISLKPDESQKSSSKVLLLIFFHCRRSKAWNKIFISKNLVECCSKKKVGRVWEKKEAIL